MSYNTTPLPETVKEILQKYHAEFNTPRFLQDDPVGIVHAFDDLRDQEIAGFWIATLAWGRRATIMDKSMQLMELMDGQPHKFIVEHTLADRKRFEHWKHRTFTATDTMYFLEWLQWYYRTHDSLEDAFARHLHPEDKNIESALVGFHDTFFSLAGAPQRTRKHVATPARKSRCKRLCMFLRWMVRKDDRGVDLGVWNRIRPDQLCIPLDVHVERVARELGLLHRKQTDWRAVLELTENLRTIDSSDPTRFDFALFGIGVKNVSF